MIVRLLTVEFFMFYIYVGKILKKKKLIFAPPLGVLTGKIGARDLTTVTEQLMTE